MTGYELKFKQLNKRNSNCLILKIISQIMKFKFVFISIFLGSCLPSPASGKCAKEMREFYQCFRKVFDLNVGQYTRGIGYDDFQNRISDCFKS